MSSHLHKSLVANVRLTFEHTFTTPLSEYLLHSRVVGIALALPSTPLCEHVFAYFDPPRMFPLEAISVIAPALSPPNKICVHECAMEGGEREESAGEYGEYARGKGGKPLQDISSRTLGTARNITQDPKTSTRTQKPKSVQTPSPKSENHAHPNSKNQAQGWCKHNP
jgi:hypothetical protein